MPSSRSIFANDHPFKTVLVAVVLCLVCSLLVTTTTILLKPRQEANERLLVEKREILRVLGQFDEQTENYDALSNIETRLVELATGEYVSHIDAETYNYNKAVANPETRVELSADLDIASVKAIARYAPVYLVWDGGRVSRVVIPVYGYGLWSTMYAYLALEADGSEVAGIRFYRHGETPGLGSEIAEPEWQAGWQGKRIYDRAGEVGLRLVKTGERDPARAMHEIDAISGATITSDGVSNLIRFWLGEQGYGPFLKRHFRDGGGS